ncbi:MAG TPA: phosphoribosylformylglycinamidine synthase subunit PurQ, partial [Dehalococcoidia bacterium]|nr:phosphoribosylformylglycinamidine synthase subunit PurQ [Dehalococcoidia bacterium]
CYLFPFPCYYRPMKIAVLVFPGTWSDGDWLHVLRNVLDQDAELVWHRESDLARFDIIVLPGGFAYGDYLRTGAIARFSPVMDAVKREAAKGKLVIGSCNGFQILCEAGLLPGVLTRNNSMQFRCQDVYLRVETTNTQFTLGAQKGDVLKMPIAHGEGNYYADPETLAQLNAEDRVVFRYSTPSGEITAEANPNGALENIAGIINEERNVLGMMPHPERASEALMGGTDGLVILRSMLAAVLV